MSDSTDQHGYNTPAKGSEDWHEPLNENFEKLDIDVEIRDVAENRDDYTPKEGAKFLETDSGIIYVGDGDAWTPALAMAYYDEDGNLACGELEACLDADSYSGDENGDGDVESPSTWGENAHSVHEGAIVFGDSTQRVIWSESANELRSQMPVFAPRVDTGGVTVGKTNVDVSDKVSSDSVATNEVNTDTVGADSIDAGVLSADGDEVNVSLGDDDEVTIEGDGVHSDIPFYAPEFNTTSARAAKTAVEPVNEQAVLEAVESMPVNTWEFTDRDGTRHIGPMAEDFASRFDLGGETDSIATVDADGVAFAAIQGLTDRLRRKNEELREELSETNAEMHQLTERHERLQAQVARLEVDASESGRLDEHGRTADD